MDFAATFLWGNVLDGDQILDVQEADNVGMFFIFEIDENFAYNIQDAGNWLWGNAMGRGGFGSSSIKAGAHANNLITGGEFDSGADQNAIERGSGFRPIFWSDLDYLKKKGYHTKQMIKPAFIKSANVGRR